MTQHGRPRNVQATEHLRNEIGLRIGSPERRTRTIAVAVAGPIERHHAVSPGGEINQSAGSEILNHAAIAVQKHQRISVALVNVVQPTAIDRQKPASGRVVLLSLCSGTPIYQRRSHKPDRNRGTRRPDRVCFRGSRKSTPK